MKKLLTFAVVIAFESPIFSQSSETDSTAKAKISRLEFMVGDWKGTGWMMGRE